MLIVDGHSSHVNLAYFDFCYNQKIILIVLPPHSTHRLQPLDVGLFGPLAHHYTISLDKFIRDTEGFSKVTKRTFYTLFRAAWLASFTELNIKSAWEKPSLVPFNPSLVLDQVCPMTPPPLETIPLIAHPALDARGIRRVTKPLMKTGNLEPDMIKSLIFMTEKLSL